MLFGYSLLEISQIIGGLSPLLLIYLYYRILVIQSEQTDLQQKQAEIMDQQNDLMALAHKPDLRVDTTELDVVNDTVILLLTNLGNGPAKNLSLRCDTHHTEEANTDINFQSTSNPLRRKSTRPRSRGNQPPEPDQAVLADEKDIEFRVNVSIGLVGKDNTSSRTLPVSDAVDVLIENNVEELGIHFFLEYTDESGDNYEQQLPRLGRHTSLSSGMTLNTIIEEGNQSATTGTITVESPSRLDQLKSWINYKE